ncbi:MAG: glycosyltransferase [Anaerolineaceae bacterium]|nr:glycosyltransferase [Anaerolineaceae bacterium]
MRILYFTQGQSPHDMRFLTALAATRHQLGVLCLDDVTGKSWPAGVEVLGWPDFYIQLPKKHKRAQVKAFAAVVAAFKPDVVHAGPIQKVASIAARARVKPLLAMSWGSDLLMDARDSLHSNLLARFTLRKTTLLAADCFTVVKRASELGYHGPIVVFPWGVDLQHFKPAASSTLREQLGWQQEFVFLSNRTLEPLYGVEVIAWAFIQACQRNEHLRLLVYGKGSQEGMLKALFEKAGLIDRVHFGGFANLEQLPAIYASADVYLSASHSDGSSVSLMEALACARPVIVSDIPSNLEWVKPGKQGWVFEDGNVPDLAEKMLQAAASKKLAEIGINNRSLAEQKADWTQNFAKLLAAYEEAVQLVKK